VGTPVTYELEGNIARITMDDGKVNALSPAMLSGIDAALDRAAADRAPVVLRGRDGVFSAGFHLPTLRAGGPDARDMVGAGFELAVRMLSFPLPVVIACTGHAIAMAVFLLQSGDYRVGASGPYRLTANEVTLGITMPRAAIEICRQRLTPAHFNRAMINAEVYSPEDAVDAGFLDRVVPPSELDSAAREVATELGQLDLDAHAATKLAARDLALRAIRAGIEADGGELRSTA
jgi:enoyl-CoA hydratase/carnithine racemase